MTSKKNVLIWGFVVFAGVLFVVTPNVQGGDNRWVSFDGAWLVSNPTYGIRGVETLTSVDLFGRKAVFQLTSLSADAKLNGLCPNADYVSVGIGEAKRTGPSTADATFMVYSMRKEDPRDQIECIWVISGSSKFTENTQDALVNFAIYPSSTNPDENGDLIPDEGVLPVACFQIPFKAKRLPMKPPCELPAE